MRTLRLNGFSSGPADLGGGAHASWGSPPFQEKFSYVKNLILWLGIRSPQAPGGWERSGAARLEGVGRGLGGRSTTLFSRPAIEGLFICAAYAGCMGRCALGLGVGLQNVALSACAGCMNEFGASAGRRLPHRKASSPRIRS